MFLQKQNYQAPPNIWHIYALFPAEHRACYEQLDGKIQLAITNRSHHLVKDSGSG